MSISSYAFLDEVNKKDLNLINYYLFANKYDNCPKNNILKNVDVESLMKKPEKYNDQNLLNYQNIYKVNN
jgi:hypothetical protein